MPMTAAAMWLKNTDRTAAKVKPTLKAMADLDKNILPSSETSSVQTDSRALQSADPTKWNRSQLSVGLCFRAAARRSQIPRLVRSPKIRQVESKAKPSVYSTAEPSVKESVLATVADAPPDRILNTDMRH